jgi:hypothetical protein
MKFPGTEYLRGQELGRRSEESPDIDVILSGGKAGARDRTRAYSFDDVDRSAYAARGLAIFSPASASHDFVRSLGALAPSSG